MQHEKVSNLLANYIGKPISQFESGIPTVPRSSLGFSTGTSMNSRMGNPALDLGPASNNTTFPYQLKGIPNMEKALMLETAASAMDELVRLLRINEPLWIKTLDDGRYVLHHESYEKIFPRIGHFKNSSARVESSKDSDIVTVGGMHLVEMILDSVSAHNTFFSYRHIP